MADRSAHNDQDLVRSAQSGALDAFTTLYERYLPLVYSRVRYTVPEQDVEDVTQEIFIAVMKSLKNFRYKAKFSTWLRTLTNRQIANYYRKRVPPEAQLNLDVLISNPEHYSTSSADIGKLDNIIMMKQALRTLPEHYREILLLRFADGLRFKEIAQLQGQSLEATKSLYRRAVAMLQERVTNA